MQALKMFGQGGGGGGGDSSNNKGEQGTFLAMAMSEASKVRLAACRGVSGG